MLNCRDYIETFLKIRDKEGKIVPLKLNPPQLRLYETIRKQWAAGKPVRIIILKARQMGFSTLTEGIIFWATATSAQTESMIVAHQDEATGNLFRMSKRFLDELPGPLRPMMKASNGQELNFDRPSRSKDERKGLGSRIRCATAGGRGVGRSYTLRCLHLSEFAFWPGEKRETLTGLMQAVPDTMDRVPTKADDPMILYFTSGTTGYPKGVIHSYSYPLAHIVTAKYWQQAEDNGLHFTVAETGWAKASWGKLYGQWLVGSAVMVYDFDNFEPKQLTHIINQYGVTSFCAPPTVYRYLVRKGIPEMPTLKHASTAGEMLAPEVFRKFTERTGLALCEGYGQTETTLLLANFKGTSAVEGSMGVPSPFYHIELRNKKGEPAGTNETGEVVIIPEQPGRQTGVFMAYLDNEKQYEYVWRGGVYHTGDAASMDENGRYWFRGRFDDIIKTGGYRVGPYEVENVLLEHPAVAECSVFGVPDPLRGQAIKAVIVPGQEYPPRLFR